MTSNKSKQEVKSNTKNRKIPNNNMGTSKTPEKPRQNSNTKNTKPNDTMGTSKTPRKPKQNSNTKNTKPKDNMGTSEAPQKPKDNNDKAKKNKDIKKEIDAVKPSSTGDEKLQDIAKQQKKKKKKQSYKSEGKSKEREKSAGEKSKEIEIETKRKREKVDEDNEEGNEEKGICKFAFERVKRIAKSEDLHMKIANDALFLINKATEKFVEKFCEDTYACTVKDRKKSISYKHLSDVVCQGRGYEFLSDFVPETLKAEDALAERKKTMEAQGS